MNILARITIFYLLLLTLVPAIDAVGALPDAFCCEARGAETEEGEEGSDDCDEGCNPFLGCHCFQGFVLPESRSFFSSAVPVRVAVFSGKPGKAIRYAHRIWHPPK